MNTTTTTSNTGGQMPASDRRRTSIYALNVPSDISLMRRIQECQSLIEDNRRLISAADRQAHCGNGSSSSSINAPTIGQYRHTSAAGPPSQQQQHNQQNHHHHHQRHQYQQTPPSALRAVYAGVCGSNNVSKQRHQQQQQQQQQQSSNVETVVLQTQIDTLQWQLKQVESSRQMYHAVMEEVVRFLDRCHHSLNGAAAAAVAMAAATSTPKAHQKGPAAGVASMLRSKSVNHVFVPNDTSSLLNEPMNGAGRSMLHGSNGSQRQQQRSSSSGKLSTSTLQLMMSSLDENLDMSLMTTTGRASEPFGNGLINGKDLTWRRSPKPTATSAANAADMAKLSQEAFRLLRTAQNLLTLKEPVLAESKKPFAAACAAATTSLNSIASAVERERDARNDVDHDHDDDDDEDADPEKTMVHCATPLSALHNMPATIQRKTNYRASRLSMQSSTDDSVHSTSSSSSSRHETDEELLLAFGPVAGQFGGLQSSASTASTSSSVGSFVRCQNRSAMLHHHHHHQQRQHPPNVKAPLLMAASNLANNDDESGFSSMSSFQDVGLPIAPPQLPPRSRISCASLLLPETALASTDEEAGCSSTNGSPTGPPEAVVGGARKGDNPPLSICHRRWSSAPAPPIPPKRNLSTFNGDSDGPLKVLWV